MDWSCRKFKDHRRARARARLSSRSHALAVLLGDHGTNNFGTEANLTAPARCGIAFCPECEIDSYSSRPLESMDSDARYARLIGWPGGRFHAILSKLWGPGFRCVLHELRYACIGCGRGGNRCSECRCQLLTATSANGCGSGLGQQRSKRTLLHTLRNWFDLRYRLPNRVTV